LLDRFDETLSNNNTLQTGYRMVLNLQLVNTIHGTYLEQFNGSIRLVRVGKVVDT